MWKRSGNNVDNYAQPMSILWKTMWKTRGIVWKRCEKQHKRGGKTEDSGG